MKRKIEELTSEECLLVFGKLDVATKRRLLSATTSDKDVCVYTQSNLFGDVLEIISSHLDLQTWGRLRQTCHLFNRKLRMHPQMISVYQSYESCNVDSHLNSRIHDLDCMKFYHACVKRFILYAHQLIERHIEQFLANPPSPEIITRMDGTRVEIFGKTPENFNLSTSLNELQHFSLDASKPYAKRKWHKPGFGDIQISYPYGFICGPDGKNPHGNIFTNDWEDLLFINTYRNIVTKPYKLMTKEQRKRFKLQKKQLAFTKK